MINTLKIIKKTKLTAFYTIELSNTGRVDITDIRDEMITTLGYIEDIDNKLDTKFVFNTDDIVELDSVRLICLYTR